MPIWSAEQYLLFEEARTRPAADLLARVSLDSPRLVTDIGCGPGNSTRLLVERWPQAVVRGMDSSPAMIEAARLRLPGKSFFGADIETWQPDGEDLLFANAVFQWVPNHLEAIARIFRALRPRAVLALQMPDNFSAPVHLAMQATAAERPWAADLAGVVTREGLAPVGAYYDALSSAASDLDLWHTSYHHVLARAGDIVEWMMGTGLRPYLEKLAPAAQKSFLAAYLARLEKAYPAQPDHRVIFSAPRFFVIARRA